MKSFDGKRYEAWQSIARKSARDKAAKDIGSANSIPALRQRVDDIAEILGLRQETEQKGK